MNLDIWFILFLFWHLSQNMYSSLHFQEISRQRRLVSWIPKNEIHPQNKYEKKRKYKRKAKNFFTGAQNSTNKTKKHPPTPSNELENRIDKPPKSWNKRECEGGVGQYPFHFPNAWFYQRLCKTKNGLMVVSSNAVPEIALEKTAFIIRRMTRYVNKKVIRKMKSLEFRQAVMGVKEMTYDIPEHSWLKKAYPDGRYAGNRGIGATLSHPVGSNAEENVLCYSNDTYWDEDITIHEFAHSIHLLGFKLTYSNFEKRLKRLYKNAKKRNIWGKYYWHQNVYAMKNQQEYFAVGVQSYFGRAARHNAPKKRSGLKKLDPKLFRFIDKYFGRNPWKGKQCNCAKKNTIEIECKLQS